MKKILLSILTTVLMIFSIPYIVNAQNNIEISNIELVEKSSTTTINNEASFNNLDILMDIKFENLNDYAKYKITLHNNDNKKYNLSLENITTEYIKYSYDYKSILSSNGNTDIFLTITYTNEVPDNKLEFGLIKTSGSIKFNLKEDNITTEIIENPNTGDNTLKYAVIILTSSIITLAILYLLRNKLNKNVLSIILLISIIFPSIVFALTEIVINTNVKIEIKKFNDDNKDNIDDSKELVSLTFNLGENGTIEGTNTYTINNLLPGYDKYPALPNITTKENYVFEKMVNYNQGETIPLDNPTLEFSALYYEDKNNNLKDDITELVSLTFNLGENGTIEGNSTYIISNILPGYDKYPSLPNVTTKENYIFNKFDNYDQGETIPLNNPTLEFNALYFDDKNNNQIDDTTELVSIIFNSKENGTIEGKSTYTVNNLLPGYDKYPEIPTIVPNTNYIFNKFDNYNQGEIIPLNNPTLEFNALYFEDKNNNQIDDSTELVSLTFKLGDKGTIDGKNLYKINNLLPGYDKYPEVPSVTTKENYVFDSFDKYIPNKIIALENPILEFNALYFEDKNNNLKDDTKELVSITFNSGDNGSIEGNSTYTVSNLLPGYDKYPETPNVTSYEHYVFDRFDNYTPNEIIPLDNPILVFDAVYIQEQVKETKYGLTMETTWYDNNSVEITLNGTATDVIFLRLVSGDIAMFSSSTDLYDIKYVENPLFKAGDNVYIKYEYISGGYQDTTSTVTIKYRDTDKNCNALNVAELIANHSKANFKLNETFTNEGITPKDISMLGVYTIQDTVFDNLKFKISYGKKN